ncbi:hypothetical protein M0804_013304 [Polistes exclamans]|nr:hypothetical protein M0804_013304 [Polistes exclamans]
MYIASGFIAFLSSTFPVVVCGAFESSSRLKELLRGQTKHKLKKRLEQHRNDSKPKNAQKTNTTALAEHHFKTGHNFKFDETKILDKEDNWRNEEEFGGFLSEVVKVRSPLLWYTKQFNIWKHVLTVKVAVAAACEAAFAFAVSVADIISVACAILVAVASAVAVACLIVVSFAIVVVVACAVAIAFAVVVAVKYVVAYAIDVAYKVLVAFLVLEVFAFADSVTCAVAVAAAFAVVVASAVAVAF